MKIVYSCWGYYNKQDNYLDDSIIYLSLRCVKKYGYQTVVYTDEKHYDSLKRFEFDEIRVFSEKELNLLPRNIWCLGKILAYSLINEPFLHFDFDVFMLKDLVKPIINNELICYHQEPWRKIEDYDFLYEHTLLNIPEFKKIFNKNLGTYNCAIIGGHGVDIINSSARLVLDYSKNNKEFLENKQTEFLKQGRYWELPVFIEQVIFVNLCLYSLNIKKIEAIYDFNNLGLKADEKKNWDIVYKIMNEKGLIHLWGSKQHFSKRMSKILKDIRSFR